MLARIPFGLTTGPIEGAEILVAGCRKETVASEMRSNVLKYRDTLVRPKANSSPWSFTRPVQLEAVEPAHGSLAMCGSPGKHPVLVDAWVVADRQRGRVDEADARTTAQLRVQIGH